MPGTIKRAKVHGKGIKKVFLLLKHDFSIQFEFLDLKSEKINHLAKKKYPNFVFWFSKRQTRKLVAIVFFLLFSYFGEKTACAYPPIKKRYSEIYIDHS